MYPGLAPKSVPVKAPPGAKAKGRLPIKPAPPYYLGKALPINAPPTLPNPQEPPSTGAHEQLHHS